MKTIITFTFLLFSFLGFSQTTREEVVERNKEGQKLVVNTYSGTGNSEKLIKITSYQSVWDVCPNPKKIHYFGTYKLETSSTFYDGIYYGCVKREEFDNTGNLTLTWKISDKNDENSTYTLIP
jgi:hypothetical protein